MTFKQLIADLSHRTGPAYGAGPAGFKRLMKRLGNPHYTYRQIHVAGTNGKGSVCYLCAQVLQQAGLKTGLFISPHVQHITERIEVNGKPISSKQFKHLVEQVLAAEKEKLNFFEILTAVALLYFAKQQVAYAVLETGLGGRKDPTNICRPVASVITSIGLDHCAVLGNTLAEIAWEKAGIIKRAVPVFCAPLAPQALSVIRREAIQKQAPLQVVQAPKPFCIERIDWLKGRMILRKEQQYWPLALLGSQQVQNACVVYALSRYLALPERAVKKGFEKVFVPGRFEIIHQRGKTIILDGAHNPQAITHLVRFLSCGPWEKPFAWVSGFMADKDYAAMLHKLVPAGTLYVTTPPSPRAATLEQVQAAMPANARLSYFSYPQKALLAALQKHNTVVVTGSFYLVAALRKKIKNGLLFSHFSHIRTRGARRD